MKATELMVGNIVEIDGKPQRIRSVSRRKVAYCRLNSPNQSYARIHDVAPIPITEELLVKNGFKSCSVVSFILEPIQYYEIKVGDKRCLIHTTMHNGVWFFGILENGMNLAQAVITHLHQLQNILNIMDIKLDFVV